MPTRELLAEDSPLHLAPLSQTTDNHPKNIIDWIPLQARETVTTPELHRHESDIGPANLDLTQKQVTASRSDLVADHPEEMQLMEVAHHLHGSNAHDFSEVTRSPSMDAYKSSARLFSEAALQEDEALKTAAEAKVNFDSAMKQLEQAKQALNESNEALVEVRRLFDQSTNQLNQARTKEEMAATDRKSAQQDLTTAYQFAAVAAQRQRDAVAIFQRSTRRAVNAVAASWIVLAWFAWFSLRALVPIWAPAAATGMVVLFAVLVARWGTRRAYLRL